MKNTFLCWLHTMFLFALLFAGISCKKSGVEPKEELSIECGNYTKLQDRVYDFRGTIQLINKKNASFTAIFESSEAISAGFDDAMVCAVKTYVDRVNDWKDVKLATNTDAKTAWILSKDEKTKYFVTVTVPQASPGSGFYFHAKVYRLNANDGNFYEIRGEESYIPFITM